MKKIQFLTFLVIVFCNILNIFPMLIDNEWTDQPTEVFEESIETVDNPVDFTQTQLGIISNILGQIAFDNDGEARNANWIINNTSNQYCRGEIVITKLPDWLENAGKWVYAISTGESFNQNGQTLWNLNFGSISGSAPSNSIGKLGFVG